MFTLAAPSGLDIVLNIADQVHPADNSANDPVNERAVAARRLRWRCRRLAVLVALDAVIVSVVVVFAINAASRIAPPYAAQVLSFPGDYL